MPSPPDPPTCTGITGATYDSSTGLTAITLGWTPSANNGSPITGYRLQLVFGGPVTGEIATTETQMTFGALQNGSWYYVVWAENEYGSSEPAGFGFVLGNGAAPTLQDGTSLLPYSVTAITNGSVSISAPSGYNLSLYNDTNTSVTSPLSLTNVTRQYTAFLWGASGTQLTPFTLFASRRFLNFSPDFTTVTGPGPNAPAHPAITSFPPPSPDASFNLVPSDFPPMCTTIGSAACSGSDEWGNPRPFLNLVNVTLPSGITTIMDGAFANCLNLKTFNAANSGLVSIGSYAFVNNKYYFTTVSLPSTCTTIANHAFAQCNVLSTINLLNVSTIGENAFESAALTSLEIVGNTLSIGQQAFLGNTAMTTLRVIGRTSLTAGMGVFMGCTGLTAASVAGLTTLPNAFFYNCPVLSNISVQGTFTSIDTNCFGLVKFNNFSVQRGVTSIATSAFNNCGAKDYEIPSTVTSIAETAWQQYNPDVTGFNLWFAGDAPAGLNGSSQYGISKIYYNQDTSGWENMVVYSGFSKDINNIAILEPISTVDKTTLKATTISNIFTTRGQISDYVGDVAKNWGSAIIPVAATPPLSVMTQVAASAAAAFASATSTTCVAAVPGATVALPVIDPATVLYIPTVEGAFTLTYSGVNYAINYDPSGNLTVNGVSFPVGSTFVLGGVEFTVQALGSASATPGGAPPQTVVCFPDGTPVLTPDGYQRIERLQAGDLVTTADGRHVAIQRVQRSLTEAGPFTNPYVIPRGMYGAEKRVLVSPNHSIKTEHGWRQARFLGLRQDDRSGSFMYYNLELPDWNRDTLVVGGVTCESLAPVRYTTMTIAEFMREVKRIHGDITPELLNRIRRKCIFNKNGTVIAPILRKSL